jgi:hypothetical protein
MNCDEAEKERSNTLTSEDTPPGEPGAQGGGPADGCPTRDVILLHGALGGLVTLLPQVPS